MITLTDDTAAQLLDLVDAVRRGRPVPPQLANQALVALTLAKRAPPPPPPLRLFSNGDGTFTTGTSTWSPRTTDAAAILAACARQPGRWLPTWPDLARRAVQGRLVRCVDDLSGTDPALARAFRPVRSEHDPGLRLRGVDGQVEARLLLHPGRRLDTMPLP